MHDEVFGTHIYTAQQGRRRLEEERKRSEKGKPNIKHPIIRICINVSLVQARNIEYKLRSSTFSR